MHTYTHVSEHTTTEYTKKSQRDKNKYNEK